MVCANDEMSMAFVSVHNPTDPIVTSPPITVKFSEPVSDVMVYAKDWPTTEFFVDQPAGLVVSPKDSMNNDTAYGMMVSGEFLPWMDWTVPDMIMIVLDKLLPEVIMRQERSLLYFEGPLTSITFTPTKSIFGESPEFGTAFMGDKKK